MFHFDTHMHFDLYKDRAAIIDYVESNASYTIGMTNLPILFKRYEPTTRNKKYFRLALGFHPELASEYRDQINQFISCIHLTKYIGEVGLDYTTTDNTNRSNQRYIFSEVVRSCTKNHILSVHSRHAESDALSILQEFPGKVILHWYSGKDKGLATAIERGYYFSINHQMVESQHGQHIINELPKERILIESDAPFTKGLKKSYSLKFIVSIYDYLKVSSQLSEYEIDSILHNNFKSVLLK